MAQLSSTNRGSADGSGQVGRGNYEVRPGDCLESIAMQHGLFWGTIWNHPENAPVKQARKDPNVLMAGDRLFIPEIQVKEEASATESRHRFRRKGVPSKISIVLQDEAGQARVGVDYVLEIDGRLFAGQTNAAGRVEHPIPPDARSGKVTIGAGTAKEEYTLLLGHLDPITTISGVQARLRNLGFDCGPPDGTFNKQTRLALRQFQARQQLQETGEADQATRDRLMQEHGS